MKVAVVILNWNGKTLMREYLPNVVRYTLCEQADVELVVADNGSTDGSLDFLSRNYPQIRLLDLGCNYGFAEGYNRALAQIDAEYVVLLNSDVEVSLNWLRPMVNYLDENPDVAACQPKILSLREPGFFEHAGAAGGFMDALGYPFCRGRILSVVEKDLGQYNTPLDIFWASGACLFIRLKDYKNAGGLDAAFFAHMEEIDLCWRLRSRSRRIVCLPESVVYHLGGATLNKENPRKTFLNYRNNLLMLYKNLPRRRFYPVFVVRFILDYLSALVFLLSGKKGDALAVLRARVAFLGLRPQFRSSRRENLARATQRGIPEVYPGCIIFDYYFRGLRTFSSVKW